MEGIKIVVFSFILWGFQLCSVQCVCEIERDVSGKIVSNLPFSTYEKCWTIPVPTGHFIYLKLNRIESKLNCENDHVKINITGTRDQYRFCSKVNCTNPIIAFGNVTVIHFVRLNAAASNVIIEYTVKTIECLNNNIFQCDANSCVPEEKVCDGMKDCKNGEDEIGCETGVLTIKEVPEVRKNAVSWLKQKRTALSGWNENTPRAVVALYLASAASFNGTVFEEELMAKQTEFKISVALLRPSLTNSELSMFINALLVTCHNPRQFYGINLVQRLKAQMQESSNFTHPLAYLALCNAGESWPFRATSDLNSILSSSSEYSFVKDLQAMAVMALSCETSLSRNNMISNTTLTLYNETILDLKKVQAHDGSFGNVYTTALVTQALFSSGQEHNRDWKLNATIKYLMKELNSSTVDFLATYLILPILNRKTLKDISYVNCSANARKQGDDPLSDISDHLIPKIRVQYSLYIGDEKPVVHTIPLRVLKNSKASEVMELAQVEDRNYKFEWKKVSGKVYVYEIANIKNDPEAGTFWLLYVGAANRSGTLTHLTKGPNEITMGDGEHLVLWYKTATI